MMWLQYLDDAGSTAEQVEAVSIRTSLRRMSHGILVLENENGQGAATVLPDEEKEGSETVVSAEAKDDDTDGDGGSEDNKGSSFARALATLGNSLLIGLSTIGYPVAVLPYYRAESTTE